MNEQQQVIVDRLYELHKKHYPNVSKEIFTTSNGDDFIFFINAIIHLINYNKTDESISNKLNEYLPTDITEYIMPQYINEDYFEPILKQVIHKNCCTGMIIIRSRTICIFKKKLTHKE